MRGLRGGSASERLRGPFGRDDGSGVAGGRGVGSARGGDHGGRFVGRGDDVGVGGGQGAEAGEEEGCHAHVD